MRTLARSAAVAALVVSAMFAGGSGAASAAETIGPNQHFIGLVNGSNFRATVYTVCAGPIWRGRTGPVVGGQTLAVARVARGHGYTGPLNQVYAWFVPDASGPPPQMVTFADYGTEQAVPTSVRVPCDGRGHVQFSPCPYLAPCVAGWVTNVVSVRFVNLAVDQAG